MNMKQNFADANIYEAADATAAAPAYAAADSTTDADATADASAYATAYATAYAIADALADAIAYATVYATVSQYHDVYFKYTFLHKNYKKVCIDIRRYNTRKHHVVDKKLSNNILIT